jgi:chromosome segregation ATPase
MLRVLREINARLHRIEQKEEIIMSGLADLTTNEGQLETNVAALLAEWTTFNNDLNTLLENNDPDAAVEAIAQKIAAQNTEIAQVTSDLQAADPVTGTAATTTTAAPTSTAPPAAS